MEEADELPDLYSALFALIEAHGSADGVALMLEMIRAGEHEAAVGELFDLHPAAREAVRADRDAEVERWRAAQAEQLAAARGAGREG